MTVLLAVDPGAPHCGVAIWHDLSGQWQCRQALELTPDEYQDRLRTYLERSKLDRLAYEEYRLGSGREAAFQRGSTLGVVEVIGATKALCREFDIEPEPVQRARRKAALRRMRAIGYRFPVGCSDHVRDAVAVGAVAVDWRAIEHLDGDGVESAYASDRIVETEGGR